MACIAYILLCHKDPLAIVAQAQRLTSKGDVIAIHFDARAAAKDYQTIRDALDQNPNVTFAKKRIKCGWGEWSLVQATLYAVEAAAKSFPQATHFYMLSGDCQPIKSARYAHEFLDSHDRDYIESFDFFESKWIKTGIKEERLIYRHVFNERARKRLFYGSLFVQKKLGLARKIPEDIQVQIGSQWWCLRRKTIERILKFTTKRRDVMRFFSTTWIPDETFFQTLVRHLIPGKEIETRTLTCLMFTDYGMPVNFYNDHYDLLVSQDYLFARKISPEATELKEKLGALYLDDDAQFQISGEAKGLFDFLSGRGRIGRRFTPRFWESDASLGRNRELLILVCKKWHVAKRLVEQIRDKMDLRAVEYIFNEEHAELPDLGGIQGSLTKRHRHRRTLMKMLFDYYQTDRLLICIDPSNLELLEDFCGDRTLTRLLEIECQFSKDYLIGHAKRSGFASEQTPHDTLERILPTIRNDIAFESDRIRNADFKNYTRMRETDPQEKNAQRLEAFLTVPYEKAHEIMSHDHLFSD